MVSIMDIMKMVRENGGNIMILSVISGGQTNLLCAAASLHDYALVSRLLENGRDINALCAYSLPVLHVAVSANFLCHQEQELSDKQTTIQMLLDAGANPYGISPHGFNALSWAMQDDRFGVNPVLKETDPEIADSIQKDVDAKNKCVLVTIQTLLKNDAFSHSGGSYNQSELTKANALLDSLSSLLSGEGTTTDHNQDEL